MSVPLSRRAVIATTAGAVALPALSGCGSDEPTSGQATADVGPGTVLVAVGDVPVGGCAVNADQKVVVTQPAAGEFRAFSAVCTHQGCLLKSSDEGEIPCTCHGSRFSLSDGKVLTGPARDALASLEVTVTDGMVTAV